MCSEFIILNLNSGGILCYDILNEYNLKVETGDAILKLTPLLNRFVQSSHIFRVKELHIF